jgi:5-methylcytosine-specific restriction endonuclease McrA
MMPHQSRGKRPPWIHEASRRDGNKGANSSFYNNPTWKRYTTNYRRAATIERMGYGCEVCHHNGVDSPVYGRNGVTDHVVPMSGNGAAWDRRNHMALCNYHHNVKRGYERHGLGIAVLVTPDGYIPCDRMEVIKLLLTGRPSKGGGGNDLCSS